MWLSPFFLNSKFLNLILIRNSNYSNFDKASLILSVRLCSCDSISSFLFWINKVIASTTRALIDLSSIRLSSSNNVYLLSGTLIDVWISLSLTIISLKFSVLVFASVNSITSFLALAIYIFLTLFIICYQALKYNRKLYIVEVLKYTLTRDFIFSQRSFFKASISSFVEKEEYGAKLR